MKRVISILITVVIVLSLSACDSSSNGEIKEPSNVSTSDNSSEAPDNDAESTQTGKVDVTINETTLVDEGGVKIIAKSLDTNGLFGAKINLLIENNSGKDLTIQCVNASVNGYMVDTMMSVDIVNGKKANDAITFLESDFEASKITSIADMELAFHMFTTADWETYLDTKQIQLKTSIVDTYEYKFDDSGNVAYDASGIKVVIKGLAEDSSIFGPSIVVYLENNSDKAFTVQTRDVSINGFMVDAMFSSDVLPGKKSVDTITFLSSELEENKITSIQDAELKFHIFDMKSWDTIVDTDVISMTF